MDEVDVLTALLEVPSPSGREGRAVGQFLTLARRLGYRAQMDAAGNGWAIRGSGGPRLLFLGHIDTSDTDLSVRRARGRLYGTGACDAKGALAAALFAGARPRRPGTLAVVAAVGEETDSRGARALVRRAPFDAVIAGEPNHWDGVGVGYRGIVRARARFETPSCHPTAPVPSAAECAWGWVERIRAGLPKGPTPFRTPTLKVVRFQAAPRRGTDRAEVEIDLRLPPGTLAAEAFARLRSERGPRSVELRLAIDPWETDRSNPVVRAIEKAIRAERGVPTFWRKLGTSDANVVAQAWERPAAVYGPGDPHLDHTTKEFLAIRELRLAARILGRAFDELLGSVAVK